ncbi:hypothetical protein TNCV_2388261 [Trichonephila clavipes]|nr:hypothetical protein TNCV_2388261 [Trichonephila clavipes]
MLTTPQILLPDPPRPPEPTTPLVQIPDQTVQIPVFQPPVHISPVPTTPTVQLFLPDPPPVHRSFYQIHHLWSRLWRRPLWTTLQWIKSWLPCLETTRHTGFPRLIPNNPQMLDTVPSLFDESNDRISFLDYFETGLAIEQQEAPIDLTMPRMKKKVKKRGNNF